MEERQILCFVMYSSLMQVVQVSIVLGVAFIPLWSQSDAAVNG